MPRGHEPVINFESRICSAATHHLGSEAIDSLEKVTRDSSTAVDHVGVVPLYLVIAPQAMRSPALPAGSLFMSSASA